MVRNHSLSQLPPVASRLEDTGNASSARKPTLPQPPRWNAETSPLKVSFWAGSPDVPDDIKEQIARTLAAAHPSHTAQCGCLNTTPERCILLPWREAFAVLRRAEQRWFEFHPQDSDWQVNGWLMEHAGLFPPPPLKDAELVKQGTHWPKLPANPTTADFAVEVLIQYRHDIEQMSYDNGVSRLQAAGLLTSESKVRARNVHQTVYEPLKAGLDAWTDSALASLPYSPGATMRVDYRLLLKRSYEIA